MTDHSKTSQDLRKALERIAYGICGACKRTNDKSGCTVSDNDASAGCDGRVCFWAEDDARGVALAAVSTPPRPDHAGGVEDARGVANVMEALWRDAEDESERLRAGFWPSDLAIAEAFHEHRREFEPRLAPWSEVQEGSGIWQISHNFATRLSSLRPTPAQAPPQAAEREGLDELIAATTDLLNSSLEHPVGNEYAEHPDDNDKRRGDSLGKDIYRARWNLRDRVRKALAAIAPSPNGTEASRGVGAWPAGYQETFDAIGKAVTVHPDGMLGISVKAFYRALSYPDTLTPPVSPPDSTGQGDDEPDDLLWLRRQVILLCEDTEDKASAELEKPYLIEHAQGFCRGRYHEAKAIRRAIAEVVRCRLADRIATPSQADAQTQEGGE